MKSYHIILGLSFALLTACQPKDSTSPQTSSEPSTAVTGDLNTRIVFVNQDTLLENYELYQENKVDLETQYQKSQNSINSKLEGFQRKVEKFQKRVYETQQRAANIAPVELQKLEKQFAREQEDLAREEQRLVQERDNSAIELEKKIVDLQIDLKNKIDEYLEIVAAEKHYDYVLIKGSAGGVLYGNKALDITEAVVDSLNQRHRAAKGK